MKIVYFHQHFSTPVGASGIRSYQMAQKLLERGHQVTIVCGSHGCANTGLNSAFVKGRREGIVGGLKVIEFDLSYSNQVGLAKRSVIFLNFAFRSSVVALTEKSDLIFATTTPLTAGIPGVVAKLFLRKKFIFEVRDLWPELPKAMGVIKNPVILGLLSLLEKICYISADSCIGLSPGIVKGIERCGVSENDIALIPNGCDIDIFQGTCKPWRPEGVASTDLMAVFCGAHGVANGLDAVIDAAICLKQRGITNIKIVLAGEGKLKKQLQTRVKVEQLDNIIFSPPIPKSQVAGLLKAADVGLQVLKNIPAFYYGTSPNKFFDYLAAGLPVLTNYPGWIADLVDENCNGYSVPPDDASAFADALEHACNHRDEVRSMRSRSLLLAKSQFSREQLAEKFVDWLER